ncbi:MAG: helix-turn-helix transcriptional regulator [Hyphomicrobiales bacterium]|nr:helix-turn-helix transcriptional regulator [Hyphomicrobiales bacterium]
MDKRDLGRIFRDRLRQLVDRDGGNYSRFAARIGLDRSALSQILSETTTRLPRAETLCRIAATTQVSLDWLLGLSQSAEMTEIAPTLEVESITRDDGNSRLAAWHREAIGYKIRYVPKSIPDLLRTEIVTDYEFGEGDLLTPETKIAAAQDQLAYSRRPETDVEVCMPVQTLTMLAEGSGLWTGLPKSARQVQLDTIATLVDELYPTFRLFLFDGLRTYSAPYTVFGTLRAAIYLGDMYLVVNSVEHIRGLTRHFDGLIRMAEIPPDRVAAFVAGLSAR